MVFLFNIFARYVLVIAFIKKHPLQGFMYQDQVYCLHSKKNGGNNISIVNFLHALPVL